MHPLSDEQFLELLEELRALLDSTEVERYNHFINYSREGRDCKYAQASLKLFRDNDQRRLLADKLSVIAHALNL
jgi:hypothetical protein